MLFTSYGFIAFIAILFILYYLIPKRFQWLLLLCADVVFYACAGWQGLCFMAVTVLVFAVIYSAVYALTARSYYKIVQK